MLTVVPRRVFVAEPGSVWKANPFAGPYTLPAFRPTFVSFCAAAKAFSPTTLGTVISSGPFDTFIVTVESRSTDEPPEGEVDTTLPTSIVSLNT